MKKSLSMTVIALVAAPLFGCQKASGSTAKPMLAPAALCAELVAKQMLNDCKPYTGPDMPTPTKDHVTATMKFGDRIAFGFEFITYDNQESTEKGVVAYKKLTKEVTGSDELEAIVSSRQPMATFYLPINEEAAKEAADKLGRTLSFVQGQ